MREWTKTSVIGCMTIFACGKLLSHVYASPPIPCPAQDSKTLSNISSSQQISQVSQASQNISVHGSLNTKPICFEPVSHKATYHVQYFDEGDEASTENGLMTLKMIRYDSNWITVQKIHNTFTSASLPQSDTPCQDQNTTPDATQSMCMTSFEDHNAQTLVFSLEQGEGGECDLMKGKASIVPGATGIVHYDAPESVSVRLPKHTLFPVAYLKTLLMRAAKLGAKSVDVFDTTFFNASFETQEAVRIETVIAPAAMFDARTTLKINDPKPFATHRLFRAELSIFHQDNKTSEPDYKIVHIFSDTGIIFKTTLDQGEVRTVYTLTDVELFSDENAAKALRM